MMSFFTNFFPIEQQIQDIENFHFVKFHTYKLIYTIIPYLLLLFCPLYILSLISS